MSTTIMELPRPRTLADVITDGIIEQAGVDAASPAFHDIEFSGLAPANDTEDAQVEVRMNPGPRTMSATRVAAIDSGEWTWRSQRVREFDVPEFHGPQRASDDLIRAARTLYGNLPALLVPHSPTVTSVVVLNDLPARPSMADALASGWSTGFAESGFDVRRALASFAAARGHGIRDDGDVVSFENGPRVLLDGPHPLDVDPGAESPQAASLAEVRADAALVSAEHQLLIDGRFPDALISLDVARGQAHLASQGSQGGSLTVSAHVVATVEHGRWRWAWADPNLHGALAAVAARGIREFGLDNKIPAFTTADLPAELARKYSLAEAVKPVLGRWTHAFVSLPGTSATSVVLLDDDELRLPPASEAAIRATLRAPVDSSLDLARAIGSYANFRQIRVDGEDLYAPDTAHAVHVTVSGGSITAAVRDTPPDPQQQ